MVFVLDINTYSMRVRNHSHHVVTESVVVAGRAGPWGSNVISNFSRRIFVWRPGAISNWPIVFREDFRFRIF
jgi:hypothetical protein